jgi:peptidoglycan/LPS O-acetylase OafA/YrhL
MKSMPWEIPAAGWPIIFYVARAWRLYPAYWVSVLALLLSYRLTNNINIFNLSAPGSIIKHILVLFSNFFILGQDLHQFLVRVMVEHAGPPVMVIWLARYGGGILANYYMLVGQAWSLSAEMMFYAIAPFVLTSRKKTFICLVLTLALRFFLLTICGERGGIWGMFFFPGAVCMFFLGAASYHLAQIINRPTYYARIGRMCFGAFFAWVIFIKWKHDIILPSRADWSVDEPRFWILYVLFSITLPFIFEFSKKSKMDRAIGEMSYPLYLIHGGVLGTLMWWRVPFGQSHLENLVIAVIFSLLAAFAINKLVEVPAEKLRDRVQRYLRRKATADQDAGVSPNTEVV